MVDNQVKGNNGAEYQNLQFFLFWLRILNLSQNILT